jgi:hypothetical protein
MRQRFKHLPLLRLDSELRLLGELDEIMRGQLVIEPALIDKARGVRDDQAL